MGVNKVILIGNLGADPEIRRTSSNQPVATLRVATNEVWTDRDGKRQERTEWHRVIAWGRLAEVCQEHLAKGRQVYVEGKIQTREWQDDKGERRYTTEVVALHVEFLGGAPGGQGGGGRGRSDEGYGPSAGGSRSGGYGPPAAPRTNATGHPAPADDDVYPPF